MCKDQKGISDFINQHLGFYEIDFNTGRYGFARKHLEEILARLEQCVEIPLELKAKLIGECTFNIDRCFAIEAGAKLAETLIPADQEKLARLIGTAPAEKLALFRDQLRVGQLETSVLKLLR